LYSYNYRYYFYHLFSRQIFRAGYKPHFGMFFERHYAMGFYAQNTLYCVDSGSRILWRRGCTVILHRCIRSFVLANVLELPVELCVALGYVAVFGSATNTFFAPLFISTEIFGTEYLPVLLQYVP